MGVDYYACPECGEVYNDCGDAWRFCEDMGHRVCKWCVKDAKENDDGEISPKDCPVCIAEAKKPKVSIADTWLLVRNNTGIVIGHYDNLSGARKRRTGEKRLSGGHSKLTIVKVATVEGCEYPE